MTPNGPGWYEDPNDPTRVRWWDGIQWTPSSQPNDTTEPAATAAPPPADVLPTDPPGPSWHRWLTAAVAACALVLAAITIVVGTRQQTSAPPTTQASIAVRAPTTPTTTTHTHNQTTPPPSASSSAAGSDLEPGTRMCQLGDDAAPFYLYLVSKVDLDFSACNNSPIVHEDAYSILASTAYGAGMDLRCHIDPGGYMHRAFGGVYSSSASREAALEFCRNVGGY